LDAIDGFFLFCHRSYLNSKDNEVAALKDRVEMHKSGVLSDGIDSEYFLLALYSHECKKWKYVFQNNKCTEK